MTAPEAITERDLALVDFAVEHELLEARCACGDFKGASDDHNRHVGSVLKMTYLRVTSRVERNADRRRAT